MRRKVSLLMAAVCLIGLLAGCRSKPATTFIIGDEGQKELPLVTMLIDPGVSMESTGFIQFLKTVPGHDREFHVEMEMLPQGADGVVRRQRLQRVRTEIMAGKGPDIFICENYNTVTVDVRELGGDMAEGGLFKYPYGVMDNLQREMVLEQPGYRGPDGAGLSDKGPGDGLCGGGGGAVRLSCPAAPGAAKDPAGDAGFRLRKAGYCRQGHVWGHPAGLFPRYGGLGRGDPELHRRRAYGKNS